MKKEEVDEKSYFCWTHGFPHSDGPKEGGGDEVCDIIVVIAAMMREEKP